MTEYEWTGEPERVKECAFCELCVKHYNLRCPGTVDAACWFKEGIISVGAPKELVKVIKKEDSPPIDVDIVEI
jgi:hypothetical protein